MSEMRKEQFTPGPWRVHLDKRNGTVCAIIEDKSGDCVARTVYRFHRGERNANGHLIATAPEMYHALQRLVGVLDDCRRGTDEGNIPPGILDRFDEATNTCRAALQKARWGNEVH